MGCRVRRGSAVRGNGRRHDPHDLRPAHRQGGGHRRRQCPRQSLHAFQRSEGRPRNLRPEVRSRPSPVGPGGWECAVWPVRDERESAKVADALCPSCHGSDAPAAPRRTRSRGTPPPAGYRRGKAFARPGNVPAPPQPTAAQSPGRPVPACRLPGSRRRTSDPQAAQCCCWAPWRAAGCRTRAAGAVRSSPSRFAALRLERVSIGRGNVMPGHAPSGRREAAPVCRPGRRTPHTATRNGL